MTRPLTDRTDDRVTLTSAGEARRAQMLASLHAELRRRRTRRRALPAAVTAAGLALVAVAGWLALPGTGSGGAAPRDGYRAGEAGPLRVTGAKAGEPVGGEGSPEALAGATVRVRPVETRVGIAERWAARPSGTLRVTMISDDDLVVLAAQRGEPLGLMRTGGVTALVAHERVRPADPDETDQDPAREKPDEHIPNHSW